MTELPGLVSVVIPVFNRPDRVRAAIASALSQTHTLVEVVAVDDGSTDDTPKVLEAIRRKHPEVVRVVRAANGGPGAARELGRRAARGEFLQYLDSDDTLRPEKLAMQVAALRRNPSAEICNGPTIIRRGGESDATLLGGRLGSEGPRYWFPSLLTSRQWGTGTPLYRRTLIDRGGEWESLRMYEDWIYEARLARLNPLICYVEKPVLTVNRGTWARLDNIRRVSPREHLRHLAKAQAKVYRYAREAGTSSAVAELQSFLHHVLSTSKRCTDCGLARDALTLALIGLRIWVGRPIAGMALPTATAILRSTGAATADVFRR